MKHYIAIAALLLFACQNQEIKGKVELQILNKKIYFNKKYSKNLSGESVSVDRYRNRIDREDATNVLMFRVSNNTQKKFLFVIDDDNLYSDTMIFEISDENKKPVKCSSADVTFNSNMKKNCSTYQIYKDSVVSEKSRLLGIPSQSQNQSELYDKASFILHPGESKTFKAILRLPLVKETNGNEQIEAVYCDLFENKNNFRLEYKGRAELIMAGLSDFQKKDLMRNGVEIYPGVLFSNYIPLIGK